MDHKLIQVFPKQARYGVCAVFVLICSACASTPPPKYVQDRIDQQRLGPELVLVPAGEFIMGSPKTETGRYHNEGPQHRVKFERPFYLGKTEVTVAQYRQFVKETGYRTTAEDWHGTNIRFPQQKFWIVSRKVNWRHNHRGEPAEDDHPVVHVSWFDAKAYIDRLSDKTVQAYRLPSEAELEYAIRAGTTTAFFWGESQPKLHKLANIKGQLDLDPQEPIWYPTPSERKYAYREGFTPMFFEGYGDGYAGTSPVGSFAANAFGLHDTTGNVWEWTEDCFHPSYWNAPSDGSAWTADGDCHARVARGASYYCFPRHVRSANRFPVPSMASTMYVGFRVARDL